ncbi:MAG TPA: fused MFS/spermidine synthase [Anaerolineales bacterium]|nr:fused MFS/spermidine synthase [Anaerolineales bacterium]HMV95533.1 fused MFS/spermidine synthase [Anaerolineales bacterium]HMX17742.1 fused MFS/spermidine synthase [Anaerolineales bacterium]HMX73220.1 fused MFS/spermidine synthase [Anaerolineales bacterium]HMZ43318.1 fused MFS/spermidine synthase [Anaerolineales bacterium]
MKKYLLFTVFVSGMTTLAAELAAGRLIGNVFGTSNLVWASIIGLILIYLTAGYFLGGKWADANPTPAAMYRILAWGAFTIGLVPYVAGPVLRAASTAFDALSVGIMAGSFIAVLILFSVPITLLGAISPFAIRLSVDDTSKAGQTSGQIYAISTLGSFIGTFLPTLVTIPTIGTTKTFLVFGLFLLFVALAGLGKFASKNEMLKLIWMPIVLAVVAILSAGQALKSNKGQVYETESAYNYIQVQEINGFTLLRLNDGQGVHSIYHPDTLQYNGPWEQFMVGPFFYANRKPQDVQRMAIVGLAAGTAARQATAVYGDIPIDGFELDEKIVEVGQKYFGLNLPNLNIHIGDGRLNLERSPYQYDIIAVDAYRPPYIPPHMTTQEFFEIIASHLTEDGVLTINVGSVPGDRRLIDGLATTIATQFASIHIMDIPGSLNTMIFATKQPTTREDFAANFIALSSDASVEPLLLNTMAVTYTNLTEGYTPTTVFTDDLAPIEWIVNDMVVSFVLQGGLEFLQ